MATLIPNSFSSYELDQEEEEQGTIFTIAQKQVIQNRLAIIAEAKLAIEVLPDMTTEYIQAEAYKRGQMEMLQTLLDDSVIVVETMEAAAADSNSQEV